MRHTGAATSRAFGPGGVSNAWRTTHDIDNTFATMLSRAVQNDASAAFAGPGRFNDPPVSHTHTSKISKTIICCRTKLGDRSVPGY